VNGGALTKNDSVWLFYLATRWLPSHKVRGHDCDYGARRNN
jgi:hypothetical protein